MAKDKLFVLFLDCYDSRTTHPLASFDVSIVFV